MAHFWMATFADGPAYLGTAGKGGKGSAINIIENGTEYAVLFCTVDDVSHPTTVKCLVGFANGLRSSAAGLGLGFPFADAIVERNGSALEVRCPCFRSAAVMDYAAKIARIVGLLDQKPVPPDGGAPYPSPNGLAYEQQLVAPDYVFPGTWLTVRTIVWNAPGMLATRLPTPSLQVDVEDARYPQLGGFNFGTIKPVAAWSGTFDLRKSIWQPRVQQTTRVKRADTFGVPSFRFEDLEVLGFRIDLADTNPYALADLARLCRPLNHHLDRAGNAGPSPGSGISDFRYQPASRTLMLELIRYGKMRVTQPAQTLVPDDSQSQHELVVRMLVGRVDDDTGQARDPAIFAPAIFVDNTWSKVVGRSLQGFDKYMAEFCAGDVDHLMPLRPDGALPTGGTPRPLADISTIRLAPTTGLGGGSPVLDLSAPAGCPGWDDFFEVDLGLAYDPAFGLARWRQSDFDEREFRRSFARSVVDSSLHGFRSVQASPIGPNRLRRLLQSDSALITGTFKVHNGAKIAWPDGMAQIRLSAPANSPAGWKLFCDLAGAEPSGNSVRITLPRGGWYRMRLSTDFVVDDDG